MELVSSDNNRFVDVGGSDIFMSLYSTVKINLSDFISDFPLAVKFLETGSCRAEYGIETARQFNLLRDRLSQIPPEKEVYDYRNPAAEAPWKGNLSPVVTSCGNLYTTSDGKDLLYEIVSILVYAGIVGVDVSVF